jgi:hypothetical protein
MCGKFFAVVIVVIAVILAAFASFLPSLLPADKIDYVIAISRFFEVMLPVLAVGALIKYLCPHTKNCCCCCGKSNGKTGCSA